MNWKMFTTIVCVLITLTLSTPRARAPELSGPDPHFSLVECIIVFVVLTVGAVIICGLLKMCKNLPQPPPPPPTNGPYGGTNFYPACLQLPGAVGMASTVTFQASDNNGRDWSDKLSVSLQDQGSNAVVSLATGGQQVTTNVSLVVTNGARWGSCYVDLGTNQPTAQLFRIMAH